MKDLVFRTAQKEVISSQVRYMVMLSEDNTSGSLPIVIYVKAGDMNYDFSCHNYAFAFVFFMLLSICDKS